MDHNRLLIVKDCEYGGMNINLKIYIYIYYLLFFIFT